jgi:hypothetical protein
MHQEHDVERENDERSIGHPAQINEDGAILLDESHPFEISGTHGFDLSSQIRHADGLTKLRKLNVRSGPNRIPAKLFFSAGSALARVPIHRLSRILRAKNDEVKNKSTS